MAPEVVRMELRAKQMGAMGVCRQKASYSLAEASVCPSPVALARQ